MLYVIPINHMSPPPDKGETKKGIVDYVIENEGNLVKCKVRSGKVRAYCWAEQLLIKIVSSKIWKRQHT